MVNSTPSVSLESMNGKKILSYAPKQIQLHRTHLCVAFIIENFVNLLLLFHLKKATLSQH